MAHFNGFVSTKILSDPFKYCDIVTSTTHKTLCGPRSGMIFFRKEYEDRINFSVFPSIQGGPHENQICALATQLYYVMTPEYKDYMLQVQKNARVLSNELIKYNYDIMTNGTDNHMILCDLRNKLITGNKIERICEYVCISINKNSVFGDKSALTPGGIRIGTAALTTRGFKEEDFIWVSKILHKVICIALDIQCSTGKSISKFISGFSKVPELDIIRQEIEDYAIKFPFYVK
jgi:glycine hydroxymethyltransferase